MYISNRCFDKHHKQHQAKGFPLTPSISKKLVEQSCTTCYQLSPCARYCPDLRKPSIALWLWLEGGWPGSYFLFSERRGQSKRSRIGWRRQVVSRRWALRHQVQLEEGKCPCVWRLDLDLCVCVCVCVCERWMTVYVHEQSSIYIKLTRMYYYECRSHGYGALRMVLVCSQFDRHNVSTATLIHTLKIVCLVIKFFLHIMALSAW